MENPSLRMNRYGGSIDRTFIVEDFIEDEFGHSAIDEVTAEQGYVVMKDHVFGHGTTTSMLVNRDHLSDENLKGKEQRWMNRNRKSVPW